jgi:hypothetical protein
MKDVLASLYSLHPCLIAETQALAAKRMLSGSIYQYPHQMNTAPVVPAFGDMLPGLNMSD